MTETPRGNKIKHKTEENEEEFLCSITEETEFASKDPIFCFSYFQVCDGGGHNVISGVTLAKSREPWLSRNLLLGLFKYWLGS